MIATRIPEFTATFLPAGLQASELQLQYLLFVDEHVPARSTQMLSAAEGSGEHPRITLTAGSCSLPIVSLNMAF